MVYLVNPFTNGDAIVDLCLAFAELFSAYVHSPQVQHTKQTNEVVLQIVPMDFFAARRVVVAPTQEQYMKLALEVYERCALTQGQTPETFPPTRHASAVMLTQSIPKSIDFRLTAEPSVSLLHENSCLHVAYSRGADDRWVSAAWTGGRGELQTCASYCMDVSPRAADDEAGAALERTPFADVAREIWETTLGIIQVKRVHWRVLVARAGVMGQEEIEGKIAGRPEVSQLTQTQPGPRSLANRHSRRQV